MTRATPGAWRNDPYRRHELRYRDGAGWTEHVSDVGIAGLDPVFPVLGTDTGAFLAPARHHRRRHRPGRDRAAAWAVGGFLGVVGLALASAVDGNVPPPIASRQAADVATAAAAAPPGTALAALDRLPVRDAVPVAAGRAATAAWSWSDADHDGCPTPDDIRRRDLTDTRLAPGGCTVRSGMLDDPYSGDAVRYPQEPVEVDHVIGLRSALRTGGGQWNSARRRAFLNDPANLLAVSAAGRRARGQADAAGWLPRDRSLRCTLVARQLAVKVTYGLWVTDAESSAMRAALQTCPGQLLPAS